MSLSYLASATPRLAEADKRLAAALARIRRARGTERPDPPEGYQPGPAAIICWQAEVIAELAEAVAALMGEAEARPDPPP
jgi:hypothetical protein